MSDLVSAGLLLVAVAVVALASIGVLLGPDVFDKLHFTGPIAVVAPWFVAAAVVIQGGVSQASLKVVAIALLLTVLGPLLGHATARSARIRQFGDWRPQPEEMP